MAKNDLHNVNYWRVSSCLSGFDYLMPALASESSPQSLLDRPVTVHCIDLKFLHLRQSRYTHCVYIGVINWRHAYISV